MNGWRPQQPRVTLVSAVFNPFPRSTRSAWSAAASKPSAPMRPNCPTRASATAKTPASTSCRPRASVRWWRSIPPYLERDGRQFRVSAGMLVSAEVDLGSRTVMEYLLSPVQKVTHEAGRESRHGACAANCGHEPVVASLPSSPALLPWGRRERRAPRPGGEVHG